MAHKSTSRVAYYYKDEIANYNYGDAHPMKPYRLRLTNELVGCYNMFPKLAVFEPPVLSRSDLIKFHAEDFIDFLSEVTPNDQRDLNRLAHSQQSGGLSESDVETLEKATQQFKKYGVDGDCPIFEGVYQYCQLYAGGSVAGALRLNKGQADIAINWSGGLHHAKKAQVSGFCYVNDIVLSILELLRYHQRVLYIDIDVHHGCGVEEAFYLTDRVMTVSFHKHGGSFFPQTGALADIGEGAGKNYSLNFPLEDGIDDASYERIFKSIIGGVMQHYRPSAIVLQGGADSLTGDKLGPFNLTLRGHGACAEYCKSFGVPLLMLGGGGYTVKNVARAWAFETAVALGMHSTLSDEIPFNNMIEYWKYDYKLHLAPDADRRNMNARSELQQIESALLQQLKSLDAAPSVAYSTVTARDSSLHGWREESEKAAKEKQDMDTSRDGTAHEGRQHQSEFFANNKDQDQHTAQAMGVVRSKPAPILNNNVSAAAASSSSSSSSTAAPMEQ